MPQSVPDGLGVRIPGFHPGGPGSIPGLGEFLFSFSTKTVKTVRPILWFEITTPKITTV